MAHSTQQSPQAIILAAGKGTRMGGDWPKVCHQVAGRPMVCWVVDACLQAGVCRCVVVVGYKGEMVRSALAGYSDSQVAFVEQAEQLGTGHAARMAQPLLKDQPDLDLFVLAGDGPLIRPQTLTTLLEIHRSHQAAATLATATLENPAGYGRVVRDALGGFQAIVEQKDATAEQLAIREVNPSYYCFNSGLLFATLGQVKNQNRQGEYYLTDVPGLLKSQNRKVCVVDAVPAEDVLSINTPAELANVDAILTQRLK